MPYRIAAVVIVVALAGCTTTVDPSTRETQTQLPIPLTSANAVAHQQRWDRCIAFRSQSNCERTVPGGRPRWVPSTSTTDEYSNPQTRSDP